MSLRVHRQVGSFGEVLSEQAIGVLIRTTLPWTSRITKLDVDGFGFGTRLAKVLLAGRSACQEGGCLPLSLEQEDLDPEREAIQEFDGRPSPTAAD